MSPLYLHFTIVLSIGAALFLLYPCPYSSMIYLCTCFIYDILFISSFAVLIHLGLHHVYFFLLSSLSMIYTVHFFSLFCYAVCFSSLSLLYSLFPFLHLYFISVHFCIYPLISISSMHFIRCATSSFRSLSLFIIYNLY